MRVCLICEGSYPYVAGGVSSWVQMIVNEYKDIEFIIWSIATSKNEMNTYKYEIPENVVDIKTIYLQDIMNYKSKHKLKRLTTNDIQVLKSLIFDTVEDTNWDEIVGFLKKYHDRLIDVLMSKEFYHIAVELYQKKYSRITFSTFLWNLRSIYFPLIAVLSSQIEDADIYHAVSTGYAGLLGAVATSTNKKPFILTEHGIYTREREEEIIKSSWVTGAFKELWIDFFHKLSHIAYYKAKYVYTLFETNKILQEELGCPSDKISIIPNGVNYYKFKQLSHEKKIDNDMNITKETFVIGMIVRVVPIKDIKTALLAFDMIKAEIPNAMLLILGPYDEDRVYYEECLNLVEELNISDVGFMGRVDIVDFLPYFDVMLLTSISEGQPLAVLEGMAVGIPQVCTNVGSCKELLVGTKGDHIGDAGVVVPIMNIKAIATAVIELARNEEMCLSMGMAGQKRVKEYYQMNVFLDEYRSIYKKLGGK